MHISSHPSAASRTQDRENVPATTTVPRHKEVCMTVLPYGHLMLCFVVPLQFNGKKLIIVCHRLNNVNTNQLR